MITATPKKSNNMHLTDRQIKKFQNLCETHLGKKVTKQQAVEHGTKLMVLMKHLYKPITQDELSALKNNNSQKALDN